MRRLSCLVATLLVTSVAYAGHERVASDPCGYASGTEVRLKEEPRPGEASTVRNTYLKTKAELVTVPAAEIGTRNLTLFDRVAKPDLAAAGNLVISVGAKDSHLEQDQANPLLRLENESSLTPVLWGIPAIRGTSVTSTGGSALLVSSAVWGTSTTRGFSALWGSSGLWGSSALWGTLEATEAHGGQ